MTPSYSERPWPPSLWKATAWQGPDFKPLADDIDVDVAIVGAGYTGLSTALHLAEKGVRVAVLEAEEPGWGASGRNGGQVIPGLKYDPDELLARFGGQGESIVRMAGETADLVFELIERYSIQCDAVRKGWIQTAHSPSMLKTVTRRARQWERLGANVALLDGSEVAKRIGSGNFLGGWIDYRAGSVQPLSYVRGLAGAAISQGANVYSNTRAVRLVKDGPGWEICTSTGNRVRARRVLIATNGYTDDLWPKLRQTILAAQSFVVASRPLRDDEIAILPGGEVTSDSRRLLVYFRRDREGRLVLGGRGPFHDPKALSEWRHVQRALELMLPSLKGIEYDFRWHGRLAVTADFMPHIHEPVPGLNIVLGFNGRGIAMATMMGKLMASYLAEDGGSRPPLPITPIKPIPFHRLQGLYMAAGVMWYRFLDAVF